ncbi:MAG: cytochrome b/b6 domain-containing protein [Gallionellaceae bacterium]|nr:cytochrome b/b6 domain-containing protein [Gallionellaceae bacterium]
MNQGYRWPLVGLHWLTLLLIVAAYVIGSLLEDMTLSPLKLKLFSWHKWVGMTVLFLLLPRLLLRWTERIDHAAGLLPWEARASAAVHGALYLLLLLAPLLGWLHSSASGFPVVWFGVLPLLDLVGKDKALAEIFKELHEGSVNLLVALVVLHAAAALYHQHVRHDGVLARMVPWLRSKS